MLVSLSLNISLSLRRISARLVVLTKRQALQISSNWHKPIMEVSSPHGTNSHVGETEDPGCINYAGSSLTMICLDRQRYLVQYKTSEPHTIFVLCDEEWNTSSKQPGMYGHDEIIHTLCNCRTEYNVRLMVRVCRLPTAFPDETSAINRLKPAAHACVMLDE